MDVDPGTVRDGALTGRLIGGLHMEAMLLADEARGYFDEIGRRERDALAPVSRVAFSCEALKVTTRLMHVIAWLLTRRAVAAGELSARQAESPARRLGEALASDAEAVAAMPERARGLIQASHDLYERVRRLEQDIATPSVASSPARTLQSRLKGAF